MHTRTHARTQVPMPTAGDLVLMEQILLPLHRSAQLTAAAFRDVLELLAAKMYITALAVGAVSAPTAPPQGAGPAVLRVTQCGVVRVPTVP